VAIPQGREKPGKKIVVYLRNCFEQLFCLDILKYHLKTPFTCVLTMPMASYAPVSCPKKTGSVNQRHQTMVGDGWKSTTVSKKYTHTI